ncbi:FecCD family ABC transporter permease [Vulgatibacter incomptus]|uniref:Vitamin B12 ABC transporter, permease component BtuC n=1 Tax=Vulgatibacter incomptus TaxID=1391653 RepID=A0A0K1PFK8_9BACT|nr:iron ABC transporter permease [Vulgatibacter incomptus]AKU92300.1 Vitamin B12 ABC transporter, permease component BtuC [Vulgatibacter incomptus]
MADSPLGIPMHANGRFSPARLAVALAVLSAISAAAFVAGALFGAEKVDLTSALSQPDSLDGRILFGLRLPRLVLAAIAGAGLSAAGAAYQGLLRNPLADPFVLGVSGGAALGGTLALAASGLIAAMGIASGVWVSGTAFFGAMLATWLAFAAGRTEGGLDATRTLLAGVIFNSFAAAGITLLKTAVSPEKAQELLFWLTGSLGYESWSTLAAAAAATGVSIAVLVRQSHALNLLVLGDDGAAALGVEVARVRLSVFLAASLAVAVAVSLTGLVAFVGLIVPHLARLALGPDQRLLVPASALGGAAFLLAADLGARLLFVPLGTELPAGALTALAGGPFFLLLLRRKTT